MFELTLVRKCDLEEVVCLAEAASTAAADVAPGPTRNVLTMTLDRILYLLAVLRGVPPTTPSIPDPTLRDDDTMTVDERMEVDSDLEASFREEKVGQLIDVADALAELRSKR